MRLLFVTPRVDSGLVDEHARRLGERGHEVEVLAADRLSVRAAPDRKFVDSLEARAVWTRRPPPRYLQLEWLRAHGPVVDGLETWLDERAADFDIAVFFGYRNHMTWAGLPIAAAHVPTVLHPLADDDPALHLSIFESTFRLADGLAFVSADEEKVVRSAVRTTALSTVGIGVDVSSSPSTARPQSAYLAYVGPLTELSGALELREQFDAYKAARPGPLELVMVSDGDADRGAVVDGCVAVVEPSYVAMFSIGLTEGWARRRPALVQDRNLALAHHARASGGALPYSGLAGFGEAVTMLVERPDVAACLGERGHAYVGDTSWDPVIDRYEHLLKRVRH